MPPIGNRTAAFDGAAAPKPVTAHATSIRQLFFIATLASRSAAKAASEKRIVTGQPAS
jgi:hypothetical protein